MLPFVNLKVTLKLLGFFDMKICRSFFEKICKSTPCKMGLIQAVFLKIQS